ncbi:ACP phosphodiesterase [Larkinella sp. C7]|jgi:acyl carrier protein phosphodiesterase|uniref:acyl carrier protein phosphodiesterase n=1 Tax=Larkinella sp. C7 TaxID=2576607 RepID=UPI001110FE32|nr:acyl carrier protein phosphodiesterase [Larkinella sp. C7]
MNILAHAYLSGDDEGLLIGNFIADFIKGNPGHPRHGLSTAVQRGIWLHRQIDQFTDQHPLVEEMRILVRPRCHKYAGAAIDVFLDHFLAVHFTAISGRSLTEFVPAFYQFLKNHRTQLPDAAWRMAGYMMQHDWLTNYQFLEGIDRSLKGMARRTAFPSNLDTAIEDLNDNYDSFEEHFHRFFPELQQHVRDFQLMNPPVL